MKTKLSKKKITVEAKKDNPTVLKEEILYLL